VSKYSRCQINDAYQQTRVQITEVQRENSHDPATTPHATGNHYFISGQTMKLAAARALITARNRVCVQKPRSRLPNLPKMARNPLRDHEAAVFSAQNARLRMTLAIPNPG
jgi:hypothetical protein